MVTERDVLTWQHVSDEFERLGPAPTEAAQPPVIGGDQPSMKDPPPATSAD